MHKLPTLLWVAAFFLPAIPEEKGSKMDVVLYVGNLSKLTTEAGLSTLFSQVGDVTSLKIMRDRVTGESRAYGFLTKGAKRGRFSGQQI